MRLVAVSDTHNRAESIAIPDGDVLLHAGDLTMKGSWSELLWPAATDDDEPCRFARAKIIEIAQGLAAS